ncbi:flavin monoamine oxidase family protein [Nocardiopsis valliformis]|uniref:flavin monoamine oxidase family protein n=1 Tax=Nocardiopsis valliformis TaxID=239974 RepID=UPI001EF9EC56|nr:FAD-dependent oxidoreductase [Nocardiopsis valliformis]
MFGGTLVEWTKVIVVGAGLAGLSAAEELRARGAGPVVVLDGARSPGGRADAMPRAELEGLSPAPMFIRADERDLLELAGKLEVPVERLAHRQDLEDLRVGEDGEVSASRDNLPLSLPWWSRFGGEWLLDRFGRLGEGVDFGSPWLSAKAGHLDAQTAYSWLREYAPDSEVLDLLEEHLTLEAGLPTGRVSLLWLIAHVGRDPAAEEEGLGLDARLLVRRLAALADVRVGHHVDLVEQDESGVRVHGDWGTYAAERVVLALSPADADRVEFVPRLSERRRSMQRQWPRAGVVQTELVYWRPFWRNFGRSGQVFFDDGIPAWSIDHSPSDSSHGRLLTHTYTFGEYAPLGADQVSVEDRARHRGLLLENVARALGPLGAKPLAVAQSVSDDGAYSGFYRSPMPPGFLTEYGPVLRSPVGRIHWAGTETAGFPENGDLSGALASGRRAAAEVAAELGS